ncbi:MAG: cohesin domain-containing protein [Patescibacteria group bacterium]
MKNKIQENKHSRFLFPFSRFCFVILLSTFYFLLSESASAAELRLDADRVDVHVGEAFTVEAVLFAEKAVNAVEGRIIFPEDMLIVKEIRDGNSSINFWVENPRLEAPGKIIFSGITPGGFSGVNNLLFSITFKAKKTGTAAISISNAKALQNDGEGTETSLALRNVAVEIKAGDSSSRKEEVEDTVQPEPFALSIARDPSISNEEWFVAFATSDKDSGVSRYEIKEYRFSLFAVLSPWRVAESPHILSDQALKSYIIVRAVDGAGNIRMAEVPPANALLWYELVFYWFILIGVACTGVYLPFHIWKRNF